MTRRRVPLIVLLLVVLGLLTSILPPPRHRVNTTPQAVVVQSEPQARIAGVRAGPEDLVGCIRLCVFTQPRASAVVLYSTPGSDGPEYRAKLVGRSREGWHELVGYLSGSTDVSALAARPPLLVDLSTVPIPYAAVTWRFGVKRTDYLLTYGHALSSEVAVVEATFTTGQTLRDALTEGMFAIIADAARVCAVRVLDAEGRMLQEIGPAQHPWLAHQRADQPAGTCGTEAASSGRVSPTMHVTNGLADAYSPVVLR
jgi:hypothetical protein